VRGRWPFAAVWLIVILVYGALFIDLVGGVVTALWVAAYPLLITWGVVNLVRTLRNQPIIGARRLPRSHGGPQPFHFGRLVFGERDDAIHHLWAVVLTDEHGTETLAIGGDPTFPLMILVHTERAPIAAVAQRMNNALPTNVHAEPRYFAANPSSSS
jgi:hypothetical protein